MNSIQKELLLNKSDFDIQEVLKSTAASFESACTQKHISIELLLMPDAVFVLADKRKIQQVLYNLIDNAIKFSENDSLITVEVSEKNEKSIYFRKRSTESESRGKSRLK